MKHVVKGIFVLAEEFGATITWELGEGTQAHFWEDAWWEGCALRTRFPLAFQAARRKGGLVEERRGKHCDRWGSCCFPCRGRYPAEGREDRKVWGPNATSRFSVHDAYEWWARPTRPVTSVHDKASLLWKFKIPLKVKDFLWLALQNRLLTKAYRVRWCPNEDATCILCHAEVETTQHLLCACGFAQDIWRRLASAIGLTTTFSTVESMWEEGNRLRSRAGGGINASGTRKKRRDGVGVGVCKAELAQDAPFAAAIGACILNSLVFPAPDGPDDEAESGGAVDATDARFVVMGVISFIPYFNWLVQVLGMDASPIFKQLEASIRNGDIEGIPLLDEVLKFLSAKKKESHFQGHQRTLRKGKNKEHTRIPPSQDDSRNKLQDWGILRKPSEEVNDEDGNTHGERKQ
ncbi:hypothetical protein QJS04_geneDACA012314 [Acorus gramineus]|uniref:Reverse transcriptase zinc-binding domain-containing protein n=1 Tax=Acorus gramineus TaxID=55184 RepID=A0AAV8ZYE5_ACOGR|nr:hypothetical protein QJS04_geneDACA012314 [Acorus gramineus]